MTQTAELRPARFSIDSLGPEDAPSVYDGFTVGETWNGWATPYFTLDVAKRVAADYAAQGDAYLAEVGETVRLYEPDNGEWDEYGPVEVEGQLLYPVGSYYWTWEEV